MSEHPDGTTHLFPGEQLTSAPLRVLGPLFSSDEAINSKYARGEVRIVTEQGRYPLSAIPTMLRSEQYELRPDFQRRRRWSVGRKSKLIESFIMNVPVPPIFLYEDEFSHYEVMDGLQRLTAIDEYYAGGFGLTGLEEWPELEGRRYAELPEQVRRGVDRRYLASIILLKETAKSPAEAQRLKQLVFERINSGGMRLEPQESRNALYDGPLNRLCMRLARGDDLCRLWGIPGQTALEIATGLESEELLASEAYQKMDDVELVLRFFAYRQILNYDDRYSLREYLDHFLKHGNGFSGGILSRYEELFVETSALVYAVLGERAFWLYRRREARTGVFWNWLQRPTKVLYDPIMFVFSQHLSDREKLLGRRAEISEGLPGFYQEYYVQFEGRTTNRSDLQERNRLFEVYISKFLV